MEQDDFELHSNASQPEMIPLKLYIPNDSINYIAKSVRNFHLLELLGINLRL